MTSLQARLLRYFGDLTLSSHSWDVNDFTWLIRICIHDLTSHWVNLSSPGRIHIKGGRTSISTTPHTASGLMTISCPPSQMWELWGQHSLSVNLCSDIMGNVVWQASFLFHVHNKFCLFFDGKSVEKSKLRWGRFHFTFKQNERCDEIDVILLGVITMRQLGISISCPNKLR